MNGRKEIVKKIENFQKNLTQKKSIQINFDEKVLQNLSNLQLQNIHLASVGDNLFSFMKSGIESAENFARENDNFESGVLGIENIQGKLLSSSENLNSAREGLSVD